MPERNIIVVPQDAFTRRRVALALSAIGVINTIIYLDGGEGVADAASQNASATDLVTSRSSKT